MPRFLIAMMLFALISCARNGGLPNRLNAMTFAPSESVTVKKHFLAKPFLSMEKFHLAYELEIINNSDDEIEITSLEIRDDNSGKSFRSYDTHDIQISIFNHENRRVDDTRLKRANKALLFVWISVEKDQLPRSLNNIITMNKSAVVQTPVEVEQETDIILGRPFKDDGNWFATNGPSAQSKHRVAVVSANGTFFLAQRFAIDWVALDSHGKAFKNDGATVEDWHCYGKELVAVADGVIVATRSDLPNNVPGPVRAVPINLSNALGNHVVLKIADDRYVAYAHLMPGALNVSVGESVKKGHVLGRLGNSGNSDAPHLHLHVTDKPDVIFSEGLPYTFESMEVLGSNPSLDAMASGGNVFSFFVFDKFGGLRRNELPLDNWIVKF